MMLSSLACILALPFVIVSGSIHRNLFAAQNASIPSLPATSPSDIVLLVDDFVRLWKQNNPDLAPLELHEVQASAEKIKTALLSPSNSQSNITGTSRANATLTPGNFTLEAAKGIVFQAQKAANFRNKERFRNPRLNKYYAKFDRANAIKARAADAAAITPNETIKHAAALVAEAEAQKEKPLSYPGLPKNLQQMRDAMQPPAHDNNERLKKRAGSSWWMENIAHPGKVPYGGDSGYVVFRNVKDYGAVGDGKTDDTASINKAMTDGNRCGNNCGASTVKPAIVYFPAGTYLVSSSIIALYNTQMIGNANDLPIIKAASSFVGLGVISSDVYTGGNGGEEEWYINQNNFLRQLRNFIIDVRGADMTDIAGVHWQVAQATSIQNVVFYQSDSSAKSHQGVFAENGSGGFMSELTFIGGAVGIRCGNQQFTVRNFAFVGCRTAIDLLWDWGWTWKSMLISLADVAFNMNGTFRGGSLLFLDSSISDTDTAIKITTPKGAGSSEQFTITIDNLELENVGTAVFHEGVGESLAGGSRTIDSWTLGKVYDQANPKGTYQASSLSSLHPKTESLMHAGGYYQRSKPQYEDYDANTFLNAQLVAKGDGTSDDSFALSLIIKLAAALSRPLFIPFGSYIVTQSINIPVGAIIVGECWSQIVAKGAFFSDINYPQAMIIVGSMGDKGSVEIQDIMFTTEGPTAGVVLVEWNIAQDSQGSAAMWDSHFRIGGAKGSHLTASACPKLTGKVNNNCIGGTMMLHLTITSSAYLENVWAWVADHDMDSGPSQTQIDIYVARGVLIESQGGPVWMYGTASEHSIFYQYLIYGAKDIFMGMIQTESPYFYPNPQAPNPFTAQVGMFPGDPNFTDCPTSDEHCAAAYGLMLVGATNVHVLGAGLYNWFQAYVQPCVDKQDCQRRVLYVKESGNIWIYNLYTIGTVEMINLQGSDPIPAKSNTNTNEHPFTSIINAWLLASTGEGRLPVDEEGDYDLDDLIEYMSATTFASCNAKFNTLDQINNAAASIPAHCFDTYIADVEIQVLGAALRDYNDIVKNKYDSKFEVYQRYTKTQASVSVAAYMSGAQKSGNFRCSVQQYKKCCKSCSSAWNCPDGCSSAPNCVDGTQQVTTNCPTEIPTEDTSYTKDQISVTYELTNPGSFYSQLNDQYGILQEWISLGDYMVHLANGCQFSGDRVNECIKNQSTYWHNYPIINYDKLVIPNPKDIIGNAYDKTKTLLDSATVAQRFAQYDFGGVRHSDLVDALSMPSLLMSEAVANMRSVVATADKVLAQERKLQIAGFISAIFMIVPFVGEAAGAIGGAAMRAIILIAGDLANVGYTIYELVDNPDDALATLFSFLLGGISSTSFRSAAAARRGFKDSDTAKLPPRIKTDLTTIQTLRGACLKK